MAKEKPARADFRYATGVTSMKNSHSRRQFLLAGTALVASGGLSKFPTNCLADGSPPDGFRSLCDGKTLAGWRNTFIKPLSP